MRGQKRRAGSLGVVVATAGSLAATAAFAQNATWLATPGSATFNTGANWSTGSVPTGTATFDASNATALTLGAGNVTVGTLRFTAAAPAYTFTGSSLLTFNGAGIDNLSANRPVFTFSGAGSGMTFTGTSSGGSAAVTLGTGATLTISGLTSTGTTLGHVSGAGAINLGARNLEVGSAGLSGTLSGTISGTGGSLTKAGAGTLTLTGSNAYTGATTISGGTLQLGDGGSTGSLAAASVVTLAGGTLAINRSNSFFISNRIEGAGSLVQGGSGTTILTGSNSYRNGTTITAGTLQIGNGGTAGSIEGNITNNATLVFYRGDPVTFAGNIDGSGTTVQANGTVTLAGDITGDGSVKVTAGRMILAGTNHYAGGSTVTGGTLQIGNGGTTGSIDGTVTVSGGGTVAFNRSDLVTIDNRVTGTGALSQIGTGTTRLIAKNDYTGGSTVSAGTLQIGDGGTAGEIMGNVVNNSQLSFNRSDSVTFQYTISGSGAVSQVGSGTLVLTGANGYGGGTTVSGGGTLQISLDSNLGVGTGGLTLDNGRLVSNASFGINRAVTLGAGGGRFALGATTTLLLVGPVGGNGALTVSTGTLALGGNNNWSGGTTVDPGAILQVGFGSTAGSLGGGLIVNNGTIRFNRAGSVVVDAPIGGDGALVQAGPGTTILTGTNNYAGNTTISGGTLQLGDGGTTGEIRGNVLNNSQFSFNRSDGYTFGGIISGSGAVNQIGAGPLVLTGSNSHSGGTTVSGGGTLQVAGDGNLGAAVGALSLDNGTLVTTGSFATGRTVNLVGLEGGTFAAGIGTLTLNGTVRSLGGESRLTIASGTVIVTGQSGFSGTTAIATGATLRVGNGGTSGGLGTGTVTNNGSLVFDRSNAYAVPVDIVGSGRLVQEGSGTLLITRTLSSDTGATISNGTLQIGQGGANGSIAGDITNNAKLVFHLGVPFTFNGRITGAGTTIQIGGGPVTLAGKVSGAGAVQVSTGGTLILTADNDYAGGTTIDGTVQLGNGGTTGSIDRNGSVVNNGTLAFNRSDTMTFANRVTGSGGLLQSGPGTTILTADNEFIGTSTVNAGTLQVGDGGTSGRIVGRTIIVGNGILSFNRSDNAASPSDILGTGGGMVVQAGTGTLTLSGKIEGSVAASVTEGTLILAGTNSYSGITTVARGTTLQLGNGGATGNLGSGTVTNDGSLVVNRSNGMIIGNVIEGAGRLVQAGSGTTILTGANRYGNGTTITAGTLQVGDGGVAGSLEGNVTNNAMLVFSRSDTVNFAGNIDGSGTTSKTGGNALTLSGAITGTGSVNVTTGRLILAGDNSYSGGTAVAVSATLQIGDGGSTGGVGTGNIVLSDGFLQFNRSGTLLVRGAISGSGSVSHVGSATTILTGENRWTGLTSLTAGTLQVGDGGTTGSIGRITIDSSTGAALSFNHSDLTTFDGFLRGGGTLRQIGAGTLVLEGINSHTGGTVVTGGGTMRVAADSALGGNGNILTLDNGTLATTASFSSSRPVSLGTGGGRLALGGNTLTLSNAVTGAGRLATDSGTLILTSDDNSYGGLDIATGATVQVGTGGTTGVLGSGTVIDDGTLVFDRSDTLRVDAEISGAGQLIKRGTGTTILTARNSYGGGTAVEAGTLQIGNGGTTGEIGGDVGIHTGAWLDFERSDDVVFDGVISGAGGVKKGGNGKLTFRANNSYAGATRITGGTLQLGDGGTSGSLEGVVEGEFGTSLVFNRSDTWRFRAGILTAGAVSQVGSGTTILTQDGSAAGGASITAGSLQFGDGGTSGWLNGAIRISGGASLIFNRSDRPFLRDSLSGDGSVTQAGSGTVVVVSENDYAGGTSIAAGTLQIGDGGTAGAIQGNVTTAGGATLAFSRSDSMTFRGTITGGGALRQDGTGTTILTGANDYGGGTTITAGTLQIGDGGTTGSIRGDVVNNGTLAFNRSDDVAFSDTISGGGMVAQIGSGTLTLGGTNSYRGGTTVTGGGTVRVTSNANLGATSGRLTLDNGTLATSGTFTSSRAVTLNAGGGSFQLGGGTLTLTGVIGGAGGLTTADGTLVVTNTNNWGGGTTIGTGSTLQVGAGGITGSIRGDVVNNGTLAFNRSNDLAFSDRISGSGGVSQLGSGVLELTGANNYRGGTLVSGGGTVQVASDANLGDAAGGVTLRSGTLAVTTSFATARVITVDAAGGAIDVAGNRLVLDGAVDGAGRLTARGVGGTLVLGANNDGWSGGLQIDGGSTVQVGNGGTTGSMRGDVANDGTLAFNRSDRVDFNQTISGSGAVAQVGSGTLVLGGVNSYGGGTSISNGGTVQVTSDANLGAASGGLALDNGTLATGGILSSGRAVSLGTGGGSFRMGGGTLTLTGVVDGAGALATADGTLVVTNANNWGGGTTIGTGSTLQVGDGATTGSIQGDVANGGTLAFKRSNDLAFTGTISGSGGVSQLGSGVLELGGTNSYRGGTTVTGGGTLQVGADVNLGAASGGLTLDAGTLAVTGSFAAARTVTVAGGGGTVDVGGNRLVLDGAVAGAGRLTTAGAGGRLVLAANNDGWSGGLQINAGSTVQVGDGGTTGTLGTGAVIDDGTLAIDRSGSFTIAGDITGGGSLDQRGAAGTTILTGTNSYRGGTTVTAGTLQLGDGTATGSIEGDVATLLGSTFAINRAGAFTFRGIVSGDGALSQRGGKTILTNANSYTGGTTIAAGSTLQVGEGGLTGQLGSGTIVDDGLLSFRRSGTVTVTDAIQGSGVVMQLGPGTLTLSGANTYSGGTGVGGGGRLEVAGDDNLGAASGRVILDDGTLAVTAGFTTGRALTVETGGGTIDLGANRLVLNGAVSGAGQLASTGAGGRLVLAADNDGWSGGLRIGTGSTVQVGNGGTTGTLGSGAVEDNGTLAIDRSGAFTIAGDITGAGSLDQRGAAGTTILTGTNRYGGGTTITAGTLQIGDGGTTGSIRGDVANAGRLVFKRSNLVTFDGVVSGSGAVVQAGPGVLELGGTNGYRGGTTVTGGGTVQVTRDANLGDAAGGLTLDNGTLATTGSLSSGRAVTLNAGGGAFRMGGGTLTLTGVVDGAGALATADGTLVVTNANNWGGGTTIGTGSTLQVGDGGATGTLGSGAVANDGVLAFRRSGTVAVADVISGSGRVAQLGPGTVVLSGANGYRGGTTVSGSGTLQVAADTNLGAAAGTLTLDAGTLAVTAGFTTGRGVRVDAGGGTVDVSAHRLVLDGAVAGAGRLTSTGAGGRLVLAADNDGWSGGLRIEAGSTVQVGNGGTTGTLGSGAVEDNGTLAIDRSGAFTIAGDITGAGSLDQRGAAGTTILTGTNRYGGGTTITAGTLQIGDGGTTGSIEGNVANAGRLVFNRSNDLEFDGVVSGSGSLAQVGRGTLTLRGTSSYAGGTTISNGGTIAVSRDANLGAAAGTLTLDDGRLAVTADLAMTRTVSLRADGGTVDLGTSRLVLDGAVDGAGRLTTNGAGGTLVLAADNDGWSGGLRIEAGSTVQVGNGGTTGTLGSGAVVVNGTLAIDRTNRFEIPGAITGSGSLDQRGTGTTVLLADNDYAGGTTITAGTLQLGNGGASGWIDGNVANNGTLVFNRLAVYALKAGYGVRGATIGSQGDQAMLFREEMTGFFRRTLLA